MQVRDGPETGPLAVFVPPLFDEANRMRRTLRLAMRALADIGIGSLLPDLPGQNESLAATSAVDLDAWRAALAAFVAAEGRPVLLASIRGGALIDSVPGAAAHWRLAPVEGASLLRTMLRARIAADREAGVTTTQEALLAEGVAGPLLLAGHLLSPSMLAQLQAATPAAVEPCRTVAVGDLPGRPLWLAAEPGEDAPMGRTIADNIADWASVCALI